MKQAMDQVRMLLAEMALSLAMRVAPENKEGVTLILYLSSYFKQSIEEQLKGTE